MAKIDLDKLFSIDGGQRFIIHLYPDSEQSFRNVQRKFSLREEKTPSASLKRMESGEWGVTDFGNDSKWRNAIFLLMEEKGVDYGTAIREIARFYDYQDETLAFRPRWENRPALPAETEGQFDVAFKEFTEAEAKTILTRSAWEALAKDKEKRFERAVQIFGLYHLKSLASYTRIKDGKAVICHSTEEFPIFYFDEGDWGKVYLPKGEKDKRFFYRGKKPARYVHGLKQATDFLMDLKRQKLAEENAKAAPAEFLPTEKEEEKDVNQVNIKLPEIIMCSGGSDALNVAAMGYRVIWRNSESEELDVWVYEAIMKLCYKLYNLPDIDATGKETGHALALTYLNMYTIWLPDEMLRLNEEGKATSKDLRDFLLQGKSKYDFDRLLNTALPYRFWDEERVYDDDNKPKYKFGRPIIQYKFNHVQAYNFLKMCGFARFKSERDKDGFFYIRIEGNIVRKIEANDVKNFMHKFLEERAAVDSNITQDLRNSMYSTNQLSVSNLANLPLVELDFKAWGADFQYFFFPKTSWKVTAKGIEESKGFAGSKYVWEDKVVIIPTKDNSRPPVKKMGAMFEIKKVEGKYDIAILDKSCMFFRFLIQTARVHWRKELEDRQALYLLQDTAKKQEEYAEQFGLTEEERSLFFAVRTKEQQEAYKKAHQFEIAGPLLTTLEKQEQKQHLVNRIYTLGYMLHRYKDPSKAWCVWAMDNKLSELAGDETKSNGGSGKSLTGKALKWMWRYNVSLSGRNPNLTKNPHIYDKVSKQTDLIIIDDCYEYLDFGFFYGDITGDMNPNPKQTQSFSVAFDEAPKFWFDSNFGDRDFSESTQRRKLVTAFSDYYHENNGSYLETRQPTDDFGGRRLFYDFNAEDWNRFYNFLAQCLHFYLSSEEKIKPPMNNIAKRNLLSSMGGRFFEWAEVYFTERINTFICKSEAKKEYTTSEGIKELSTQKFTEYCKKYAEYHNLHFNPLEYQNNQGRIIRDHNGKREEMLFFRSVRNLPIETGSPLPLDNEMSF